MRVCVIGPAPPLRGGIAQHTAGLAATLAARGHLVRVISYARMYPRRLFPGRTDRDDSPELGEATLDTMRPATWLATRALIRRWTADLVVAQWWHPCAAGALAAALGGPGTRVAVVCHNARPHETVPLWPWLMRLALRPAHVTICHSRAVAQEVRRLVPWARCEIVDMPLLFSPMVEPTTLSTTASSDDEHALRAARPIALFAGLVRSYKGVGMMLEAWDRACLPPGARLVIAGESYLGTGKLDALVRKTHRPGSVLVVDRWLTDAELWGWMSRAHALVMPYLQASQSGLVPLAVAAGTRVIASDAGGLAESLPADGQHAVFPAGDVGALARALECAMWSATRGDATRQERPWRSWDASWSAVVRACEAAALGS